MSERRARPPRTRILSALLRIASSGWLLVVAGEARADDLELEVRNRCPRRADEQHPTDIVEIRVMKRGGGGNVRVDRDVTLRCGVPGIDGSWQPTTGSNFSVTGTPTAVSGDTWEAIELVRHSKYGSSCPANTYLYSVEVAYEARVVDTNITSVGQTWSGKCPTHDCPDITCPCPDDGTCVEDSECECGPQKKCEDGSCVCKAGAECWCTGTCISQQQCDYICRNVDESVVGRARPEGATTPPPAAPTEQPAKTAEPTKAAASGCGCSASETGSAPAREHLVALLGFGGLVIGRRRRRAWV
jgi:MYXO-CTERM domain-containing protein